MEITNENISSKSRMTALLLSFFLGVYGAHLFYVGKNGSAITMLICSLLIIPLPVTGIINLVHFIKIAMGTFKDSEGNLITEW